MTTIMMTSRSCVGSGADWKWVRSMAWRKLKVAATGCRMKHLQTLAPELVAGGQAKFVSFFFVHFRAELRAQIWP